MDLVHIFAGRPRWLTVAAALVFLGTVGAADYLSGRDISLSVFYVIPIALTTWYVGRDAGAVFALLSTVAWFLADDMGRPHVQPLVPYWNAVVRLGVYLVMVVILAKLRVALERERNLSREDSTTGIANARAFFEWASKEVERARRFRRPVTVLYIDFDDFKLINDRHGHAVGDEVLRVAAQAISGAVRDLDFVARLGGDEFAVVLPETDSSGAEVATRRLSESLQAAMASLGWQVTVSVGVATFAGGLSSVEDALREADNLMYLAKRGGKNAVRFALFGDGQ